MLTQQTLLLLVLLLIRPHEQAKHQRNNETKKQSNKETKKQRNKEANKQREPTQYAPDMPAHGAVLLLPY